MKLSSTFGCYLAILITALSSQLEASNEDPTVNILIYYDDHHLLKTLDGALEYIKTTPSLKLKVGNVHKQHVNVSYYDPIEDAIESLCKNMENFTNNYEQRPDLVFDLTQTRSSSESVKTIVKGMNLPTISSTFGLQGDFRTWRELPEKMRHYLIHISPPVAMLTQAVRSIVSKQELDNAALIYDHNGYNFQSIRRSPKLGISTHPNFKFHYESIYYSHYQHYSLSRYWNINNTFVASTPTGISKVLDFASVTKENYGPYTTKENSWYSMSMDSSLPNCTACKTNVSLIHLSPRLSQVANKRRDFLSGQEDALNLQNMTVSDMALFDLVANGIMAVGKMKRERKWTPPPNRMCKDTDIVQDDYELDLYNHLNSEDINAENLVGEFVMHKDMIIGKSFVNFEMNINLLSFQAHQKDPESNVLLGTWTSGFGEKELIKSEGHEEQWLAHRAIKKE